MKFRIILLFILLAGFNNGYAQSEFMKQLKTEQNDSIKVHLYESISNSYLRKDFDSTKYYAGQGILLAQKIGYGQGKISMLNLMGVAHFYEANYDSAIIFYTKAFRLVKGDADLTMEGKLLNNIGVMLYYQAQYDTALTVLFQAREIREKINDPKLSSTLNNIGLVYNSLNLLDKSAGYYKKAAFLKESNNDRRSLSNTYNNIGIIYKKQKQYDSAIIYFNKSLQLANEFDDEVKQANAYNNLAISHNELAADFNLVNDYYKKSLAIKRKLNYRAALFNSLFNYASFLNNRKQPQRALTVMKEAESLEKEIGENMFSSTKLITRANIYKALGRYQEANDVLIKAIDAGYYEKTEEFNSKIAELEVKYETVQKEAEIKQLSLENELQEANLSRSKLIQIVTAISLVVLIIFLIIFFTLRTKKQQVEKEAQALQLEALQKRLMELHASPSELATPLELTQLNDKLNSPLTEREFEALKLSLEGKTNKQISEELFISVSTVKFHLRNTYSKMGVKNRKEAFQQVFEKH